jgi:hypothetical protein
MGILSIAPPAVCAGFELDKGWERAYFSLMLEDGWREVPGRRLTMPTIVSWAYQTSQI